MPHLKILTKTAQKVPSNGEGQKTEALSLAASRRAERKVTQRDKQKTRRLSVEAGSVDKLSVGAFVGFFSFIYLKFILSRLLTRDTLSATEAQKQKAGGHTRPNKNKIIVLSCWVAIDDGNTIFFSFLFFSFRCVSHVRILCAHLMYALLRA